MRAPQERTSESLVAFATPHPRAPGTKETDITEDGTIAVRSS